MICELPKFWDYAEPVAKKQHKCCECSAPILKGEKHFHGWGKWDWGMESFRQHLLCEQACELIRDEFEDGDCIGFGTLFEWYDEARRDLQRHKQEPTVKRLRSLIAQIKRRERIAESTT